MLQHRENQSLLPSFLEPHWQGSSLFTDSGGASPRTKMTFKRRGAVSEAPMEARHCSLFV
jgi:hypothetical protein